MFKYKLSQQVYLKTDLDQFERMVVERREVMGGSKSYLLSLGTEYSVHFEEEMALEADEMKRLGIGVQQE